MVRLASNPRVRQLANELGLAPRGNCMELIREFALARVSLIVEASPIPAESLDALRRLVANKYRVRLDEIAQQGDVQRIANENTTFHPHLERRLVEEFVNGTTEGITIEREQHHPVQ